MKLPIIGATVLLVMALGYCKKDFLVLPSETTLLLRALSYFDLVQYSGKMPLHLLPATSREETALPLTGTDRIDMQIIADAQQAAALLPAKVRRKPAGLLPVPPIHCWAMCT